MVSTLSPTLLALVFAGGGAGSVGRLVVGTLLNPADTSKQGLPWGTLTVNAAGCLLLGVLLGAMAADRVGQPAALALGVGVLGGFTTFSAFGVETASMVNGGRPTAAIAYALASVIAGVIAAGAGAFIATQVWGRGG